MFLILFKASTFIVFMFWYSLGIWNVVDVYFKNRFQSYLDKEYKKNVFTKPEVLKLWQGNGGTAVDKAIFEKVVRNQRCSFMIYVEEMFYINYKCYI